MDMGAMLAGKRVLVTGASSGLGENFARLAAGCKAKVVIAARRKARLEALASELAGLGAPQVTVIVSCSPDSISSSLPATSSGSWE